MTNVTPGKYRNHLGYEVEVLEPVTGKDNIHQLGDDISLGKVVGGPYDAANTLWGQRYLVTEAGLKAAGYEKVADA